MNGYVLGSDAVLDLENIWEYIATDNIEAADRWTAKLFDAFDAIARMPGIGHRREDLTDYPILFWNAGAYLVIYRAEQGHPVEIVAVTQGARDIPSFLRRRRRWWCRALRLLARRPSPCPGSDAARRDGAGSSRWLGCARRLIAHPERT